MLDSTQIIFFQRTLFPAGPSIPFGPGKPSTPGSPGGPSLPFTPVNPTGPWEIMHSWFQWCIHYTIFFYSFINLFIFESRVSVKIKKPILILKSNYSGLILCLVM